MQTASVLAGFLKEIRQSAAADFAKLTEILIPFTNSKGMCAPAVYIREPFGSVSGWVWLARPFMRVSGWARGCSGV